MVKNPDEVVFSVSGSTAVPAEPITLAQAGLREREHLQEWVIAHPEIIGADVMIVTFEFDRWQSSSGPQKDRLDVLGLGGDGRLVVSELKRDAAPDTVDMQAVKYAAMASRFSPELLAQYHARFTHRDSGGLGKQALSEPEARAKLEAWSGVGLLPDLLVNPRIVLLAESFPPSVTATAVWLNERGVDLTLMSYHAYRIRPDQIVLTVSQLYPVREVADFVTRPTAQKTNVDNAAYPEVPWTPAEMAALADLAINATALAVIDLCALSPDKWVGSGEAYARAGVTVARGTAQFGGFGLTVRARFKRSNPPYENLWAAGGLNQSYYRLSSELAAAWREVRGDGINVPLIPPDDAPLPLDDDGLEAVAADAAVPVSGDSQSDSQADR